MKTRFPSRPRRNTTPLEKHEQAAGLQLLTAIGAKIYVLGTRRSRGKPCPKCKTFVAEDQGTRQTEGIPDVFAFLPPRAGVRATLWWEAKRSIGGRMSSDQKEFAVLCDEASAYHCVGDRDDLIAWLIAHGYLNRNQVPHYRQPATTEAR